jgi:peptidoglycan/xylan/chitin deacetylase (PgdA/CDA1 family)
MPKNSPPILCLTFDDKYPESNRLFDSETGNRRTLDTLDKYKIKAAFFVLAEILDTEQGRKIVESWDREGHLIANHSFSHLDYNNDDVTFEKFKNDFLKADSLLSTYKNFYKIFRYPKLSKGNTREKVDLFRNLLQEKGYQTGYVTINNSEWYINDRLRLKLREDETFDPVIFKDLYLDHIQTMAYKYDRIATEITGRKIPHILLLHNNITSALFLEELIIQFTHSGWQIISAEDAFNDDIYTILPDFNYIKNGENFIDALARQNGREILLQSAFATYNHRRLVTELQQSGL